MSPPYSAGVDAGSSLAAVRQRVAELQARFVGFQGVTAVGPPASAAAFERALADAEAAGGAWLEPAGTSESVPDPAALATAVPAAGPSGADVVEAARRYLGVPYLWGGTDPARGLDCSGFVQRVYADLGVRLPRVSRDQARVGQPVASLADARPGDLVAFGSPVDHIGIYVGDGKMLAAPRRGEVVKLQPVYRTPTAIRRVLADAGGLSPSWGAAGGLGLAPGQGRIGASVAGSAGSVPLAGSAGSVPLAGSAGSVPPAGSAGSVPLAGSAGSVPPAGPAGGAANFAPLFARAGAAHGVPPALLRAVAQAESGFNPRAVSGAGARGLMQLMPATARELGVDPLDPAQAINGAARLLASHLRRFGSVELALAAYNAGPGAVARHGGVPPFAETRRYVRRVMSSLGQEAS